MRTKVTFRHLKSIPELHEAAIDASEKFGKFHPAIISTDTIFTHDIQNIVEFTVKYDGGTVVAKESSEDFYKSLNEASDKIIRQLQKAKTKSNSHVA